MRLIALAAIGLFLTAAAFAQSEDIRVAVISGGHDFEKEEFLTLFRSIAGIQFRLLEQTDDDSAFLENIDDFKYDVIVLYNMGQNISDKRKENLITLLDKGIGLVVLHHAIADFNKWPEFSNIIGAHYYLEDVKQPGKEHPRSQYQHDVNFHVKIQDKEHPVSKGIEDFDIKDETYKLYDVAPDNHILLTTDTPTSEKQIGWAKTYKNSNVCFIQLGHGADAYFNPAYRRLVSQAIRWADKK
ncbi:MAG: ThuA domain-containing protein [Candidatus Hydrogenedentes bacterium]|nr:ThuA domain-containing protein [Candidatus Hydrogenedentota bacterium]